ncbi:MULTISPECIES: M24 family metallopeptidase [unclassified Pseudarthrobacter]|uniref:M24 family metallopeptidase n=1 Tax=unclassified Pseudarthrobacter TaxID=2647000 RepID=UPI0030784464
MSNAFDSYVYRRLREQGIEKELAFPREEYEGRVQRAIRTANDLGLDALLLTTTPSIGYVTGADTCMPPTYLAALVTADGDLVIQCAEPEVGTILRHSIVDDLIVFPWTDVASAAGAMVQLLQERGLSSAKIGMELSSPENFGPSGTDVATYQELTSLLTGLEVVDVAGEVMELRLIKSAAELDMMRAAGRISTEAALHALGVAAEGVSENEVAAEAYAFATRAGSNAMSIDPIVATGERTGLMPHLPYRNNILRAGDPVFLEMTGTVWRYNAPIMRSAVIGRPSKQVEALSVATLEVLDILFAAIKPGRTGDDIARLAVPVWKQVPDAFFHGGYGYAIGMGFQPTWTENPVYIELGGERVLEPGMTFHLAINPWVPGGEGIGFSESIVVTESGCELLTLGTGRELLRR